MTRPDRRRPTVAVLCLLALVGLLAGRILKLARAISTQPLWRCRRSVLRGRIGVALLGYGGAGHEEPFLTDSMLVLSLESGGRGLLLSVPRDLWVEIPAGYGRSAKLNSAYAHGREVAGPPAGAELAVSTLSRLLGLPIEQWVTIDFAGFRGLVDALGGVDLEVERGFSAAYPAHDDPRVDPSWITVTFAPGWQHFDGATAICYARARFAEDPVEGTDFARSRRQRRLVAAIAARLKRPTGWLRAWAVMDALESRVQTSLSPLELAGLLLRLDPDRLKRAALHTGNVLLAATSDDGRFILLPRGGDWDLIKHYVREQVEAGPASPSAADPSFARGIGPSDTIG